MLGDGRIKLDLWRKVGVEVDSTTDLVEVSGPIELGSKPAVESSKNVGS